MVRDIVWQKADTVVWFDLPYAIVLGRTIRRTVRRTITREELWNGNKEPFSNLWSLNPEKSIIAWAATTAPASTAGATRRPSATRAGRTLRFVRLRTQGEADAFLADVSSATMKEE